MPLALIVLGFGLVGAGMFFAIRGIASSEASGSAMKGFAVSGPSWLILVALGAGIITFGAWQFESRTPEGPPKPDVIELDAYAYGDDEDLDMLWDWCEMGDMEACDILYLESPVDSDYEWFGATCGDTVEANEEFCVDLADG